MSVVFKILLILIMFFQTWFCFASENTLLQSTHTSPEFFIVFQNPSYIDQKDESLSYYNCDKNKDICKVNLNLTQEN